MGGITYKSGSVGQQSDLGPIGEMPALHGRYVFLLNCFTPDPKAIWSDDPCKACIVLPPPPPPPPPPPTATYASISISIWEMVTDSNPPRGSTSPYWIAMLGNYVWSENLLTGETNENGPFPTGPWALYQGGGTQSAGYILIQTSAATGPPPVSYDIPDQNIHQVYNTLTGAVDSVATQQAQSDALNSALAAAHAAIGV